MSQSGRFYIGNGLLPINTLTGNTGGPVGADDNDNVNVIGTGDVTVVGDPGTNTLTIELSGAVTLQFDTDSGTATPSAGVITIAGGTNVSTSGSGSTVTINAVPDLSYTAVSTTPYIALSTDQYLGVNSSGGAITIELPNAPATGRVFVIKDSTGSAASHHITVTTVGGSVDIDGATTYVMNTAYESVNVIFNSTSYEIY